MKLNHVKINPGQIGNLTDKQKAAHKKAVAMKTEVEEVGKKFQKLDDVVDVDRKHKEPGEVDVQNLHYYGGDPSKKEFSAKESFDPESGKMKSLEYSESGGPDYTYKDKNGVFSGGREVFTKTTDQPHGANFVQKLTVSKKTGAMTYDEYIVRKDNWTTGQ